MFNTITIKNFRCFTALELSQLGRINLIAGKNNTGKTAVLEAIQIHNCPNDCQQAINICKIRGINEPMQDASEFAGWLFHDKNTQSNFEIGSQDQNGESRTLKGWFLDHLAVQDYFPELEKRLQTSFRPDLVAENLPRFILSFIDADQVPFDSISTWSFGSVHVTSRVPWNPSSILLGSTFAPLEQDLKWFGELEVSKRQDDILPALRLLEPRLDRLAVIPIGRNSFIHGDIGLPRLQPINLMGEGLRRLLSLLLAIVNAKDGFVMIDEIENGLHHSILKQVWKAITVAARKNNVQVFATTHSYECIQAAHAAFMEMEPYDLKLFRLERRDASIRAIAYDETTLNTSVDMNMEVR